MGITSLWLDAQAARRLLGGYTGDVLGAVEQIYEISFLLALAELKSLEATLAAFRRAGHADPGPCE